MSQTIDLNAIIDERMRNRKPDDLKEVLTSLYSEYALKGIVENKEILKQIQSRLSELYKTAVVKTVKAEVVEDMQLSNSQIMAKLDEYEKALHDLYQKINALSNVHIRFVNITGDPQFMPQYAHDTDACLDLRVYTPDKSKVVFLPGEQIKISCGLKAQIPEGYAMKLQVRSSIGIKKKLELANQIGVIDAGYRDEIFMVLRNTSSEPVTLQYAERVCQFDILKKVYVTSEEVQETDKFLEGNRGGGIGSTGES